MGTEWIETPFSIVDQFFLDDWRLPKDPAEEAKLKRALAFDAEHYLGGIIKTGGFDGRSYTFRTRHGCKEDLLARYLPAAHAQGLRVLVYLNMHWFGLDFPQEMAMRKADGSLAIGYGKGWLSCPNGPFLNYALEVAQDISEYEIDGVFLDGPMFSMCWCEYCREDYRRRYGREIPQGGLSVADRRRMEEWRAGIVGEFVRKFRETLRRKRPDAVVYGNAPTLGQFTFGVRQFAKAGDILGIEGGFLGYSPLTGQFIYKTSATCKFMEALAGGKPTVCFNEHSFKGYDYSVLGRAEIDILHAATLAGGANPWFHMNCIALDTCAGERAKYWNQFIAQNRELLAGTHPVAGVGILWSDATALVTRSAREEEDSVHAQADIATTLDAGARKAAAAVDHFMAFKGAYALLARSGIPSLVVTGKDIIDGLKPGAAGRKLQVVIAPSVLSLGREEVEALEKFASSGGIVIADDRFAMLDADGRVRDAAGISEFLGAVPEDDIPSAQPNLDYIAHGKGTLFKGMAGTPLPRPTRAFGARLGKSSRAIAYFHEPMNGRYDYLPAVSKSPAIVERKIGDGRIYFMPMNFFEHYMIYGFDDCRLLLINLLRLAYEPEVEVKAPAGLVEILVRGKSGQSENKPLQLHVHLLNYAGSVRPFADVAPLSPVEVRIRGKKVRSARALHLGKDLPVRSGSKGTVIRLAKLNSAETIVVEIDT